MLYLRIGPLMETSSSTMLLRERARASATAACLAPDRSAQHPPPPAPDGARFFRARGVTTAPSIAEVSVLPTKSHSTAARFARIGGPPSRRRRYGVTDFA